MIRTFILCVIGRLIFMGGGIGSSVWTIKSGIIHFSQVYDLAVGFGITERGWMVILFGCILLLAVSVAQEIRERMGLTETIRGWLMRQNLWLKWCVMMVGVLVIIVFGVYGSGTGVTFIYEQF